MPRAKRTRLMAQVKLFKVPKPRIAPATILVASLAIGLVLGGVVVDTLSRERVRPVVELLGERPERSTTTVAIKKPENVGELLTLTVQLIENGRGRVLLRVHPTYFESIDVQESARNAWVAVNLHYDLRGLDAVFIFESEKELHIEGPSAGASMAATLYALARSVHENKSYVVRNDTVASGAIDDTGQILPVGEVEKKAWAVSRGGYTRFVVSRRQGFFNRPPNLTVIEVRDLAELVSAMVAENAG